MPGVLRRLLHSHEFIERAILDHRTAMTADDLARLMLERDRLFDELVDYRSSHPPVTMAQFKFLLSALVDEAKDHPKAARLKERCIDAAERLAVQTGPDHAKWLDAEGLHAGTAALLDNFSDRVAICDANFRYLYVNQANADLHGAAIEDFIGRSPRSIVGKKIFDNLSRPVVERCLRGEAFQLNVGFRRSGKSSTFSGRMEPLRSRSGKVVAVMLVSRDVTGYSIPVESVWTLPQRRANSD